MTDLVNSILADDGGGHSAASVAGHSISLTLIGATFMSWLPGIAAFLAVVWYVLQIYESRLVQEWLSRRRETKRLASIPAMSKDDICS